MIRILAVGKDKFTYNRTAVLLAGLRAHPGVIIATHTLASKDQAHGQLLRQQASNYDYMLVPSFRHSDVAYVKKWSRKPVIFDPLISKFSTKVIDYKQYWKPYKYILDYLAFHKSDLLIADTETHRLFYKKVFGIPFTKSVTIPVGVDTNLYSPQDTVPISDQPREKFVVGFYGSFVPLQGTHIILEAAKYLLDHKEILIRLIGTGYEYQHAIEYVQENNLTNVDLAGWVDYTELKEVIEQFDICLGIFGSSQKANSVVPNKVYHYAALGKPIITKDSMGIREVFNDDSAVLIDANPKALADAIQDLKVNTAKCNALGNNALAVINHGYTHHHIAQLLVDKLQSY